MLISVDESQDTPLFKQLEQQIIAGIARGELQDGEQLPSARSLACDLGINLHTVNKAYADLRAAGYVTMKGRSRAQIASLHARSIANKKDFWAQNVKPQVVSLAEIWRAKGGAENELMRFIAEAIADVYQKTPLQEKKG